MKRETILEAFEQVVGDGLTPASVERLANAPAEQVRTLLERLVPYYGVPITTLVDDYFYPERGGNAFYFSIDPETLHSEYVNIAEMERFARVSRQFQSALLYLERIALPDPFDFLFARPLRDLIGGTDEVNAFYGESDSMLQRAWHDAVTFLEAVSPLVRAGIVGLVPYRWLSQFASVDRTMLQSAFSESFGERAVLVPHGMFEHVDVAHAIGPISSVDERDAIADAIALNHILSELALNPMARTEAGRRALDVISSLEGVAFGGQITAAAIGVLVENQLPGIARVPLANIVALRQDDESFNAWRGSFSEIVARAQSLPVGTEAQYRADLAEAATDLLSPKIERMKKSLFGSIVLRDLIEPGAVGMGVGGLATELSHNPWSLLTAVGTPLVKFAVGAANRAIRRTGPREKTLRDLYTYVVDSGAQ